MKLQIQNGKEAPSRADLQTFGIDNPGGSPWGSSKVKTLLSCPREHALSSSGVKTAKSSDALDIGTLVHLGLETYYRALMNHQKGQTTWDDAAYFDKHLEHASAAIGALDPLSESEDWHDVYSQAVKLLEAYFDGYWRRDRWRVIAVEEGLAWDGYKLAEDHPLHFRYSSRLDLVIEDENGIWLVEHKTAKSINAGLIDHYAMDLQIMGHKWLWEHCVDTSKYGKAQGVLVNIITKHREPRLERFAVSPSPDHLREFERMMQTVPIREKEYEYLGWPKSLSHCAGSARGYGRCAYYALCHDFPAVTPSQWGDDFELPEGFTQDATRTD